MADRPPSSAARPNAKEGEVVLFRHKGGWIPGVIIGPGTEKRVALQRRGARRIYWRNRTQIFAAVGVVP